MGAAALSAAVLLSSSELCMAACMAIWVPSGLLLCSGVGVGVAVLSLAQQFHSCRPCNQAMGEHCREREEQRWQ